MLACNSDISYIYCIYKLTAFLHQAFYVTFLSVKTYEAWALHTERHVHTGYVYDTCQYVSDTPKSVSSFYNLKTCMLLDINNPKTCVSELYPFQKII